MAQPGAVVAPGGLTAIARANFGLQPYASDSDRRRKLAEWVTHPENPLFARMIVNRVWHYHFGAGIVETPSDFGFNGGRPSHPELLDWLAAEFADRKYSLKALHRLIVTSATYRRSPLHVRIALQPTPKTGCCGGSGHTGSKAKRFATGCLPSRDCSTVKSAGRGSATTRFAISTALRTSIRSIPSDPSPPPEHLSLHTARRESRTDRYIRLPGSRRPPRRVGQSPQRRFRRFHSGIAASRSAPPMRSRIG